MNQEFTPYVPNTIVDGDIKIKQEDGSYIIVHPNTKEGNIITEEGIPLKEKIDKAVKITTEVPNTVTVGGLLAGETYDDLPLSELLFKLTHPYVQPDIQFSCSPNGGVYEIGQTVGSVNINATGVRKADMIQRVRILKDNQPIETVDNSTQDPGNIQASASVTDISTNTSFKADVYDGKNTRTSGTTSFTFVNPAYIGTLPGSVETPTSDQIKGMSKKVQTPDNLSQSFTVEAGKMCLACPPGWTVNQIIDPNNFNITASFSTQTVKVMCLDGTERDYTVYLSALTTQTNFVVKFNR